MFSNTGLEAAQARDIYETECKWGEPCDHSVSAQRSTQMSEGLKEVRTTGVLGQSTTEERTWRCAEGGLRKLSDDQHMCVRILPERKGKGSVGLRRTPLGLSQTRYQPEGKISSTMGTVLLSTGEGKLTLDSVLCWFS